MQKFKAASTKVTPQSEAIPGREKDMVPNQAGGVVFPIDDWTRLERFLILGTEGGSYYATERKMTIEAAGAVLSCLKEDGPRAVQIVKDISHSGRAPKNDPALFVLALAMTPAHANLETRKAAFATIPDVARIPTHYFHLAYYLRDHRGWGRGLKTAIQRLYLDTPVEKLAYHAMKYKGRDGYTHGDMLRLAHPKTSDEVRNKLFRYMLGKEDGENVGVVQLKAASELAKFDIDKAGMKKAAELIVEHNLPREVVPTEMLKSLDVWEALLQRMPMTAMIRNLGKMTNIKLLKEMSDCTSKVTAALGDAERLKKARVHPLQILSAMTTYKQGHGFRGSLTWDPVREVVDALDEAFYLSFDNIEPTGKRIMLALDVSGSMTWDTLCGVPGVTPRDGTAAMSMITARTESKYVVTAFAAASNAASRRTRWNLNGDGIVRLSISPRQRLDDVIKTIHNLPFGGTDCALPMIYAEKEKLEIDAFCVYTDNETWAGNIQPVQALQRYRQKTGIPAKLIVVGMTSSGFTIADPDDGGMMDVVGFDTAAPAIMSDFIRD